MRAWHKVPNFLSRWCYVVICRECLKLGLCSEQRIQIQTDIFANLQDWIQKWYSNSTTLKFLIPWLKCLFTSLRVLKLNMQRNWLSSMINILLSLSSALILLSDLTSQKELNYQLIMGLCRTHLMIYLLKTKRFLEDQSWRSITQISTCYMATQQMQDPSIQCWIPMTRITQTLTISL